VVWWSELLTTSHEVPGYIPGSVVGIFPCREDPHSDHSLGRLWNLGFKPTPGTPRSYVYHHSYHRGNVTGPYGRPNLRSRLNFGYNQEEGLRSLYGHVMELKKNIKIITIFSKFNIV
jgi:hypothetical protein